MDAAMRDYNQRWIQNSLGRPYLKAYERLVNRVIKKIADMDVAANETLVRHMAFALKCSFESIDRDLKQASRGAEPIRKSLENQEINLTRQLKNCNAQVTAAEGDFTAAKKNLESTQKLIDESQKAVEEAQKGVEEAEKRFREAQEANQKNDNCDKKRRKRRSFSMCSLLGYWSIKGTDNVHQRLSMAFQSKHQAEYRLVQRKQTEHTERARYNQAETRLNLATRRLNETKSKLLPIQETQQQLANCTSSLKNVETFIGEVFGQSNALKDQLINLLDFTHIIEPLVEMYEKVATDKLLATMKITIEHPTEAVVQATAEKLKSLLEISSDIIDNDPRQIKPQCAGMKDV